jgi:hypothetical protein
MEITESYISHVACHHISIDARKTLINKREIDLSTIENDVLKDFFLKPFFRQKREYVFSHPVNISFNILYDACLKIFKGADFTSTSVEIAKHLISQTTSQIKDGDLFIVKIEDVKIEKAYCDAIGIFKVETQRDFIETKVEDDGSIDISVTKGFTTNKIDKSCLVVFTPTVPTVFVIDSSKDTKYWKDNFIGVVPKSNSYNKSTLAVKLVQEFLSSDNGDVVDRETQISYLNRFTERMKSLDYMNVVQTMSSIVQDSNYLNLFEDYRIEFERRENVDFSDSFEVNHKAIIKDKSSKRIKLDDTAEIYIFKSGSFIEHGFDSNRNMNYYKIYYSDER